MNSASHQIERLGLICLLLLAAADPTSKPAPGPDTSISKDQYHFPAPPVDEWRAIKPDPAADQITYINKPESGAIQLAVAPKDFDLTSDNAMQVAVAIAKQLKDAHTQKHETMVMPPKIEKDKRFDILVHEKYKPAGSDKVADQIHVYKSVGPRVLMLTVNSVSDDEDVSAAILAAGKDLLDAVKFNRKAFRK